MNNQFYDDLKRGEVGENFFYEAMARKGIALTDARNDESARRRDIDFFTRTGKGVEVKTDYTAEYTGNLFIETYNTHNPSRGYAGWFFYTQAERLAFVLPNKGQIYVVDTAVLRAYVSKHALRKVYVNDGNQGYILPIRELKKWNEGVEYYEEVV